MVQPDVAEIRKMLQVFDQSSSLSVSQAVRMLKTITRSIAKDPEAFDLLTDPADAEAWRSAGGESYSENQEFTNLLAARWMEVLSRPDFANAGLDKDEVEELQEALLRYAGQIEKSELEFGNREELESKLEELLAAAPEPADSSEDDSEESE
eukprot:GHRQ01032976.1.p1 GENE.GHRQ01032976.1~~GHRQ01032976.1.p1  ORF type:complete len:152 (+),score=77.25 GHRQ01032976.1:326-781(+)